jgi:hypothetical protein
MHNLLLFILLIFIQQNSATDYKIEYGNGEEPEYVSTPQPQKPAEFIEGIDPQQEIHKIIEKMHGSLCSFPEETLKASPTLALYCIVLALLWLFLVLTLGFGYIRQIIQTITNGFRNNRPNTVVDEEQEIGVPGLLSLRPAALNNQIPQRNDNQ